MDRPLFVFIIISLLFSVISQKAYLLTTSVGYYNYRQLANVLEIYHILKNHGYEDHQVLFAFPENVGCCEKNALQGSISFQDNVYDNMNRQIETDYKYYELTAESMANVMTMKYPPQTLNLKRIKLNDQPYFMYLTGHGGDFYFKFRQRQALIDQNFQHIFRDLSKRRPNMPIFIIVDSCSAITPYLQIKEDNIIILASSSLEQKSLSKGYDKVLNCPKADQFTFYLSQYIDTNNPLKTNVTINKLYEFMDFKKLKVHSKIVSANKKNKGKLLREFMSRTLEVKEKKLELEVPASFSAYLNQ